jgi:hypothetical protein
MARLALALALAALLVPAIALASAQRVSDPHGDGHRGCEIYSATAGHVKRGRLKHTVTMKDRIKSRSLAPIVLIFGRRGEVGGAPRVTLSTGSAGVKASLSKSRRTVTYTIRASTLRFETSIPKRQKSYFWVANGCFANPDWAPGAAGGKPRLKAHAFRR